MSLIFNAVLPVFIIIFLGFLAEKRHLLGQNSHRVLTSYVYYFALPPLLFISMANEPVSKSLNFPFIFAFSISMMILYLFGFYISGFFKPANLRCSSIRALAISSPNTAYMGIPILIGLFGNGAVLPVALSTIISVFILAISIFILELTNRKTNKNNAICSAVSIIFGLEIPW